MNDCVIDLNEGSKSFRVRRHPNQGDFLWIFRKHVFETPFSSFFRSLLFYCELVLPWPLREKTRGRVGHGHTVCGRSRYQRPAR